jgi:hypothetical protein
MHAGLVHANNVYMVCDGYYGAIADDVGASMKPYMPLHCMQHN